MYGYGNKFDRSTVVIDELEFVHDGQVKKLKIG